MIDLDDIDRAARQRSFYLKVSPYGGAYLSNTLNGGINPGYDSLETEVKDSVKLWMKVHAAGAFDVLQESAWWMTRFQDRQGRMSRQEANTRCDELTTYAVAALGMLMDQGVIQFAKEPEIPTIVTSTFDEATNIAAQAILDNMMNGPQEETPEDKNT